MAPHTNQRAELEAILVALEIIASLPNQPVEIYSDSQYAISCLTVWCKKWKQNGWQSASRKPVENQDLIRPAIALLETLNVKLIKVAGHAGIEGNEMADALAVQGIGSL